MESFNTCVIHNFLTDEEITEIETIFNDDDVDFQPERYGVYMSKNTGDTHTEYPLRSNYYYPGNSRKEKLYEIIQSKIQKEFGSHIGCANWHILNAFIPYGIHSDSFDDEDAEATRLDSDLDYAWTFLIPMENYNSNTIVFAEESTYTKSPARWIKENNVPIKNNISEEFYQKYLTHEQCEKSVIDSLTVDTVFPWTKGSLLAMGRHRFHSSDNFPANGVKEKRALIGWSYMPKTTNN